MSGEVVLYDYWRSSAAYRVRIALNLKGAGYRSMPVNLLESEQRSAEHRSRNPLGLVPVLEVDGVAISQSLAIIDYLDIIHPEPRLLPAEPLARAQVLAQAMTIISEVHPLQNLRVTNYLRDEMGQDGEAIRRWLHRWIGEGLAALETAAPDEGLFGGASPNLLDVCLVPQMYSSRRFELPFDRFPKLVRIDAELRELPAFISASPEVVRG